MEIQEPKIELQGMNKTLAIQVRTFFRAKQASRNRISANSITGFEQCSIKRYNSSAACVQRETTLYVR